METHKTNPHYQGKVSCDNGTHRILTTLDKPEVEVHQQAGLLAVGTISKALTEPPTRAKNNNPF